jgi:cytochrome P450
MSKAEADGEVIDLVARFSRLLPIDVICEMMGVPKGDNMRLLEDIDRLGESLSGRPDDIKRCDLAVEDLKAMFSELGAARRANPEDDLVTALITRHEEDGEALSDLELTSLLIAILSGGGETTTNVLTSSLKSLAENPDQRIRLAEHPELGPSAAEEFFRLEPPLQTAFKRRVLEDTEVAGETLRREQWVVAFIAAGNRDPAFEVLDTNPSRRGNFQLRSIKSMRVKLNG